MLEKIIEIGQKLENFQLNSTGFLHKSEEFLKNLEITANLGDFGHELGGWILKNPLPKQLNVYNNFGQPPVTVFRTEKFVIDIYFWMQADTSVHSHSFCGAFKVLFGKSLHEKFTTKQLESYSKDVCLNKLTREKAEILQSGETKVIERGDEFIHRVIHLSSPTVTICIRTVNDKDIPQWHYFDNGLSILKRELDESVYKKLFYGDYLQQTQPNTSEKFTSEFIDTLEISEVMNLFEQLSVDTMNLSDDYQELVYNLMMTKLTALSWYGFYESYCEKSQHYDPNEAQDEAAKLIYHTMFYEYEESAVQGLVEQL